MFSSEIDAEVGLIPFATEVGTNCPIVVPEAVNTNLDVLLEPVLEYFEIDVEADLEVSNEGLIDLDERIEAVLEMIGVWACEVDAGLDEACPPMPAMADDDEEVVTDVTVLCVFFDEVEVEFTIAAEAEDA
jgi:hypothetical protein